MAVYKGVSLRMFALTLAMVCIVFLSVEAGQVQAASSGCDQSGIISTLSVCVSLTSLPAPGSPCCNAMNYVHNTLQPSDQCICNMAKTFSLAGVGVTVDKMRAVIEVCVGAPAVPACL